MEKAEIFVQDQIVKNKHTKNLEDRKKYILKTNVLKS
jgi:hypothetical protein